MIYLHTSLDIESPSFHAQIKRTIRMNPKGKTMCQKKAGISEFENKGGMSSLILFFDSTLLHHTQYA